MSVRFLTAVSGRAFNMRDRFGREIDYMRISVIDSCNLNCYYCNPQDNNKNCQAINTLSVKKVLCIVRAATRLGITHFRLTGGEPLLHPQIDEMVSQIKKIPGVRSVSLTTNAVLLAQHAKQLKETGPVGQGLFTGKSSMLIPKSTPYHLLVSGNEKISTCDDIGMNHPCISYPFLFRRAE